MGTNSFNPQPITSKTSGPRCAERGAEARLPLVFARRPTAATPESERTSPADEPVPSRKKPGRAARKEKWGQKRTAVGAGAPSSMNTLKLEPLQEVREGIVPG